MQIDGLIVEGDVYINLIKSPEAIGISWGHLKATGSAVLSADGFFEPKAAEAKLLATLWDWEIDPDAWLKVASPLVRTGNVSWNPEPVEQSGIDLNWNSYTVDRDK